MKLPAIFIILFLCFNCLYAQSHKTLTLPIFKESPKIDSLFNTIIDQNHSHNIYFSFDIMSLGNETMFSVVELKNKKSGLCLPLTPSRYKPFGYFKFRGFTIFIFGDTDINHFFKKTNDRKLFKILWYDPNTIDLDMNSYGGLFEYKNGKFSFWDFRYDEGPFIAKPKDSL